MRLPAYIFLLRRELSAAKARSAIAVLATAFAAAVWIASIAAAWVVLMEVAPQIEAAFPANRLVARPQTVDLLVFRLGLSRIPEAVAREATAWPGVRYVARQVALSCPVRAEMEILGNAIETDAIVMGVDAPLVADDLAPGKTFEYRSGSKAPVPVLASRYFLDMYNVGYAESNSLPRLNEAAAIGRTFDLILGESVALGGAPPSSPRGAARSRRVTCEVVGLTRDVNLICLAAPRECVEGWNQWFDGKPASGYSALHVSVNSARAFDDVERRLTAAGLKVESNRELLDRARLLLRLATAGAIAFGLLVAGLAGMNLLNVFTLILMQQRRPIGLMLAVGASPRSVFLLFAGEALCLTAAGCALGGTAAVGAFLALRGPLARAAESFSFLGAIRFDAAIGVALATLPLVAALVALFVAPQVSRAARRSVPELLQ